MSAVDLTHASFFSGAGGLDHGLELAGWRTVSLSEVDPYACAVLAERFPGVPNLGDITTIDPEDIPDATLWTGGFPCQDLSKAGKRRGFGGDRSVLAFAFLDLVERRRPEWFLLENVDGLLTSNNGRDFARLTGEVDGLGYGLAWRVLDAQWFGVAQRRRRVFLVASRDSDRAGAVLLDAQGGRGDPPACVQARQGAAGIAGYGADISGTLTGRYGKGINTTLDDGGIVVASPRTTRPYDDRGDVAGGLVVADAARAIVAARHGQGSERGDGAGNLIVVGPSPDADRVRAAHGLAGRLDDREGLEGSPTAGALTQSMANGADVAHAQAGWLVADPLQAATGRPRVTPDTAATHLIVATLGSDGPSEPRDTAGSLRAGGGGQGDSVPILAYRKARKASTEHDYDDPDMLPQGIDTHRYRLTGNGVVAPVATWIGRRLRAEIEDRP